MDGDPALADEDVKSGGYLLSMDYEDDMGLDRVIETNDGMTFTIESPETNASYFKKYIVDYLNKVEEALFGTDFATADGVSYKDLMDLDSAVGYWWMQEFSENGDAYAGSSTYLYKKRNTKDGEGNTVAGKLYWGPLWDFDYVAWGAI